MRYTETRLAAISHEAMLLAEIGEETVEFIGNFDNSQGTNCQPSSPLLLNGSSGIAWHEYSSTYWGSGRWSITLIDHPELPDEELFELTGLPTGGCEQLGFGSLHQVG